MKANHRIDSSKSDKPISWRKSVERYLNRDYTNDESAEFVINFADIGVSITNVDILIIFLQDKHVNVSRAAYFIIPLELSTQIPSSPANSLVLRLSRGIISQTLFAKKDNGKNIFYLFVKVMFSNEKKLSHIMFLRTRSGEYKTVISHAS